VLASGHRTVASGTLLSKFTTLAQTFGYATDNYSYVKYEMSKVGYFNILNVLGK